MQVKSIVLAAALAAASIPLVASAQFFQDGGSGHQWHHKGMRGGPIGSNPTLIADRSALESAFAQLRADAKAGNTSAIADDQAAIGTALGKLQSDRTALTNAIHASAAVQSAKSALQADHLAVEHDRVQLRSDQIAGNTAAVATDKQALAADMAKVRTDLKSLSDAIAAITL